MKNLSNDGMTVGLGNGISEDREVTVSFNYDDVPFSAKGKVTIAKKHSAYIRFENPKDEAAEKMINFIKSKKSGTIDNL